MGAMGKIPEVPDVVLGPMTEFQFAISASSISSTEANGRPHIRMMPHARSGCRQ